VKNDKRILLRLRKARKLHFEGVFRVLARSLHVLADNPRVPATGPAGEQARSAGLTNLTRVTTISKDGEHFHLTGA
jgi:hypothetical protein